MISAIALAAELFAVAVDDDEEDFLEFLIRVRMLGNFRIVLERITLQTMGMTLDEVWENGKFTEMRRQVDDVNEKLAELQRAHPRQKEFFVEMRIEMMRAFEAWPDVTNPPQQNRPNEPVRWIVDAIDPTRHTIPQVEDLASIDLSGKDLSFVNFAWADFTGANLENSDLRSSNFYSANFTNANLRGARLEALPPRPSWSKSLPTNLQFADFTGADLTDATMEPTRIPVRGWAINRDDLERNRKLKKELPVRWVRKS